jgi:hypothetical protein
MGLWVDGNALHWRNLPRCPEILAHFKAVKVSRRMGERALPVELTKPVP